MKFRRYDSLEEFRADVFDILISDEVCNNLPISIISEANAKSNDGWLMATVTDAQGGISLVALCTKPFNMLLCAPRRAASSCLRDSVGLLSDMLHNIGFDPSGVFAKTELANSFANAFAKGGADTFVRVPMHLMKLTKPAQYDKPSGICRELAEDDLSFVPFWEQAFSADCRVPAHQFSFAENKERIRTRLGLDIHYIWEDGVPVSQAVYGRKTPNGGVITWVYTPPLYRGHGYATAVVGELSNSILARKKTFCCLFAESANKTSRGIYSRLGYYDICEFEQINFS
ncbi:MAG: GNAT family N-acetyltransferase [Oscillospiraceae bacterium]|nr:GNAT family N-acetyltransferase [Oscillospiraceae bacterium]